MHNIVSERYYNITRECVTLFLSFCEFCENKSSTNEAKPSKAPTVKPKLNVKTLNGRAWVTFVEQPPIDDFHFIMLYIEYSTKFCHIKAVKDMQPLTIAWALVEILTGFGSPYVMHIDVEKELQMQIIHELSSIFPAKIVIGEQNEAFDKDMENEKNTMLKKVEQLDTLPWPVAIKLIQYELNQSEIQCPKQSATQTI